MDNHCKRFWAVLAASFATLAAISFFVEGGRMNTRRNFMRGLSGLGAIVATGHAPAIVKSMIAARGTMLGGAHGWRNPYITDGLVAMWDGEWNAGGGGVHDANATVWKNLVGNNDFSWSDGTSGIAWGDNYIELTNGNKKSLYVATANNITGLQVGASRTVEIVMSLKWIYTDLSGNVQAPFNLTGAAFPAGRWNGQVVPHISLASNGRYYAFSPTAITPGTFVVGSYCVAQEPVLPCTIYANGRPVSVGSDYNDMSTGDYDSALLTRPPRADARLYSIRVYNRPITAAEIAANYAVDKKRFNLAS